MSQHFLKAFSNGLGFLLRDQNGQRDLIEYVDHSEYVTRAFIHINYRLHISQICLPLAINPVCIDRVTLELSRRASVECVRVDRPGIRSLYHGRYRQCLPLDHAERVAKHRRKSPLQRDLSKVWIELDPLLLCNLQSRRIVHSSVIAEYHLRQCLIYWMRRRTC